MLKALDVPDELEESLSCPQQVRTVCTDVNFFPMKVAISVVDALPSTSSSEAIAARPSKRLKVDEPVIRLSAISEAPPNNAVSDLQVEVGDRNAKATKADDTAVPEYLWDRLLTPSLDLVIIKSIQFSTAGSSMVEACSTGERILRLVCSSLH